MKLAAIILGVIFGCSTLGFLAIYGWDEFQWRRIETRHRERLRVGPVGPVEVGYGAPPRFPERHRNGCAR